MNAQPLDLPAAPRRCALGSAMELVGLPYVRGGVSPEVGFDCFTLMGYVRWHWFRRETPIGAMPMRDLAPHIECARIMARVLGQAQALPSPWVSCTPHEGCGVALGRSRVGGLHHCGVWIEDGVLHALQGVGVCFTPAHRLADVYARVEFYECRG